MTLCLRGYQFGQSNHTVYLIDALRKASPELLAKDWFATQTLQYHAIFGAITELLLRWNLLEPGFLVGYLLLLFAMHLGWHQLTLRLGGTWKTYLVSVVLFHLSAGGLGLGVYHFLQDAAFLPSNIANVAMLWGFYFWIAGKPGWAGAWLGAAGLFHLNHAVMGIGVWMAMSAWCVCDKTRDGKGIGSAVRSLATRGFAAGSVLAIGLSMINIGMALSAGSERGGGMPLGEFIDLYVRLRHPHHYDPSSWPVALWVCFLWTMPLAIWAGLRARRNGADGDDARSRREAMRIYLLICGVLLIALIFAGVWYVSERLVQMSLYRFSIYVTLFNCIAAAWLIQDSGACGQKTSRRLMTALPIALIAGTALFLLLEDRGIDFVTWIGRYIRLHRGPVFLFIFLTAMPVVHEWLALRLPQRGRNLLHIGGIVLLAGILIVSWNRRLGVEVAIVDDADYLAMCDHVRGHTPVDAVFLVPPQEQAFRLRARRAIVINFKGVAQFSGELAEWRDRLEQVLGMEDLRSLPIPMKKTLDAIGERYRALPAERLVKTADMYGASYIVASRRLEDHPRLRLIHENGNDTWFLYHLHRGE